MVRPTHLTKAVIVFFCAIVLAACSSLDDVIESAPKPGARLLGAGVRNLSLRSLDLVFDVEVSNPYGVSLPLVDLNYTLGSGSKQLLTGSIKPSGSVPAYASSVVQLPARLDLGAVMKTLPGIKPGAVVPYSAEIVVVVEPPVVGQMKLPLKRNGEIPVPTIPEITLTSFDVDQLSLDRVSGKARLRIRNTNQFAIDFSQIRFDLAMGGRNLASTRFRSSSKLAPGQSSTIEIPITFAPSAAGAGLLDLLGGSDASYAISGRIDVMTRFGELALPFSQRGNTAVRHQ